MISLDILCTTARKFFLAILPFAVFPWLCSCSTNLTAVGNPQATNSAHKFFEEILLYYNGEAKPLSEPLLDAYSSITEESTYFKTNCHGTANIVASVNQVNEGKSIWYLGAAFIPFFPALPVNEDWTYKLSADIFCEDHLVRHFEFIESEHIEAFWFGAFRSDLVNKASINMHQKLIERLKFELKESRPDDLNSARG